MSKMDKNMWFKEPVTEKIAEGYHKTVKTPMDLGTILKKVDAVLVQWFWLLCGRVFDATYQNGPGFHSRVGSYSNDASLSSPTWRFTPVGLTPLGLPEFSAKNVILRAKRWGHGSLQRTTSPRAVCVL